MKALWILVFWLIALPAYAQFTYLDNPALTTGDDADRVMIVATGVSSTQSSIAFGAQHAESGIFTVVITTCTACNMTPRLEAMDPDGTWYAVFIGTALSATGTTRYEIGARINTAAGDLTTLTLTRLPPKLRFTMLWNSGTTATYNVEGMVW